MRRVPIDPPGGSALPLGNPNNPYYSVAVSDEAAIAVRAKHDEEVDLKRLFPKKAGAGADGLVGAVSSALQSPVREAVATLSGRRVSAEDVRNSLRRSEESRRTSHETRPKARDVFGQR